MYALSAQSLLGLQSLASEAGGGWLSDLIISGENLAAWKFALVVLVAALLVSMPWLPGVIRAATGRRRVHLDHQARLREAGTPDLEEEVRKLGQRVDALENPPVDIVASLLAPNGAQSKVRLQLRNKDTTIAAESVDVRVVAANGVALHPERLTAGASFDLLPGEAHVLPWEMNQPDVRWWTLLITARENGRLRERRVPVWSLPEGGGYAPTSSN